MKFGTHEKGNLFVGPYSHIDCRWFSVGCVRKVSQNLRSLAGDLQAISASCTYNFRDLHLSKSKSNRYRFVLQCYSCVSNLRQNVMSSALATEYMDVLSEEVVRLLDQLAPLKTATKQKPTNDCCWQINEALDARYWNRRLECRYIQTWKDEDRRAYNAACRESNLTSKKACEAFYKQRIDEAAGCRQQWKIVGELLHSRNETVPLDDDECRRLAQGQNDFFISKVSRIRNTISSSPLLPICIHRRNNSATRTEFFNGYPCSHYRRRGGQADSIDVTQVFAERHPTDVSSRDLYQRPRTSNRTHGKFVV